MSQFHTSVFLKEAIDFLEVKPGNKYIDATAGGAGHSFEILQRGGLVLAIDRDPDAIEHIKNQFKILNFKFKIGENLRVVNGNFSNIENIARENGFENVHGIIFDLGVSSHQLDIASRGFSFQTSGPLDMRMDPSIAIRASDIINNFDKRRLNEIFQNFGQEKFSRPITEAIIGARQITRILTTRQLADIVASVYRQRGVREKINPATRVFLALRIVVNSEILNLRQALPQTVDLLERHGRLVVITFHSLEDGEVKRFFKDTTGIKALFKSPIGPSQKEKDLNPRVRSAKLRVAQKI